MTKKTVFKILLIILLVAAVVFGVIFAKRFITQKNNKNAEDAKVYSEDTLGPVTNDPGTTKSYEDEKAGFSLQYPSGVSLNETDKSNAFQLKIQVDDVQSVEGDMGYGKETTMKNMSSLNKGEFGENVDWPVEESKKVIKIGDVNAQEFMVLGGPDVCDVLFERKAYFFRNNYRVVITLEAPKDFFVDTLTQYFKTDKGDCGGGEIWGASEQKNFYQDLENGNAPEGIKSWFGMFDQIINSIKFR
jgi:hypothetical protein